MFLHVNLSPRPQRSRSSRRHSTPSSPIVKMSNAELNNWIEHFLQARPPTSTGEAIEFKETANSILLAVVAKCNSRNQTNIELRQTLREARQEIAILRAMLNPQPQGEPDSTTNEE